MTLVSSVSLAAIPSPTTAVWQLGPVPIRAYALCIVLGIVAAVAVTEVRLRRRGVAPWAVLDIAVWAVPAGIIGARIYHVITSPQAYFGAGGDPLGAFKVWEGGLGIWGAVAGGAVGAWLAARQLGIPLTVVADALAPGLPLAQAIGRLGNWFNNELYGGETTLPWGLRVYKMSGGEAALGPDGQPQQLPGLYHPTFAYEALWNVGVALLVWAADRRFRFGRGRAFALYVMGYTAGRFWIELMRTDPANEILGLRLNVWTALLVFVAALVYFLRVRGPREYLVPLGPDGEVLPPVTGPDAEDTDREAATAGSSGTAGGAGADSIGADAVTDGAEGGGVAPSGYRVTTEEAFRTYQRTGELPGEPAGGELTDNGRPAQDGQSSGGPRPAQDGQSSGGTRPAQDGQPADGAAASAAGRAPDGTTPGTADRDS